MVEAVDNEAETTRAALDRLTQEVEKAGLYDKVATELSDEWQSVEPHKDTVYIRVA